MPLHFTLPAMSSLRMIVAVGSVLLAWPGVPFCGVSRRVIESMPGLSWLNVPVIVGTVLSVWPSLGLVMTPSGACAHAGA